MARADEKNVVVSDESEESESSTPAEDPVLDVGVPLASSAAADAGPGPGADVRFCRKCKTNSYLRKGGCSNPGCDSDFQNMFFFW